MEEPGGGGGECRGAGRSSSWKNWIMMGKNICQTSLFFLSNYFLIVLFFHTSMVSMSSSWGGGGKVDWLLRMRARSPSSPVCMKGCSILGGHSLDPAEVLGRRLRLRLRRVVVSELGWLFRRRFTKKMVSPIPAIRRRAPPPVPEPRMMLTEKNDNRWSRRRCVLLFYCKCKGAFFWHLMIVGIINVI